MQTSHEIAFCLAEDRADSETGLRLAILSLARHAPEARVFLYRPSPTAQFSEWVGRFPQVTFIPDRPEGANSWNCKPHALAPALAEGYRQAVWLDSDIILTRDVRPLFARLDDRTVACAQEPASLAYQGTEHRTRAWGLEVGKPSAMTFNSCVVRVTKEHLSLLDRWTQLMQSAEYLRSQRLPLAERPLHMMGDQDVLNALLGSREFASIPIRLLRSGTDVIHAGGALGYSLRERLAGIPRKKPAFLHASAGKPWLWLGGGPGWSRRDFFGWHRRLLQEVSPYVAEARRYKAELGMNSSWMEQSSGVGTALRVLGLGHFALRGLPITAVATVLNGLRIMRGATIGRPATQ